MSIFLKDWFMAMAWSRDGVYSFNLEFAMSNDVREHSLLFIKGYSATPGA